MSDAITVLLVDDHAVVREGYRGLLGRAGDIAVVGEAGNAADAYREFCRTTPDVVVMDISLPGVSGIEALRRMLARTPQARVLMFSMYGDPVFVRRALDAGAAGYLTKAAAPEDLVAAVRAVSRGQTYLSRDIAQLASGSTVRSATGAPHALSERELEVLRLWLLGHTLEAIAAELSLSPKTVANHQSSIKQKLGVETAAQLWRSAIQSGLVPDVVPPNVAAPDAEASKP